ncbi:MAG TPA: DUF1800 family protein [Anaerolineaceae bacterium]
MSRKLCRRLISDEPPESVVQAAAQTFLSARNDPDQLAQVYRTILFSPQFRATWGGKIKRPFEFAAGVLRALNADFLRLSGHIQWTYEMMGQPLFGRHSPDGYPDRADYWANSMATLFGWNFIISVAENWGNEDVEPNQVMRVDLRGETPGELRTAENIVDYWIERIHGRRLPDESRQAIINLLRENAAADEDLSDDHLDWRLPAAVELILMAPEMRLR